MWQDAVDMKHKMKHWNEMKQISFEIWNPPWNEMKQNIEIFVGSGWMWWFSFCNVAIVLMVLENLASFQVKILLNYILKYSKKILKNKEIKTYINFQKLQNNK